MTLQKYTSVTHLEIETAENKTDKAIEAYKTFGYMMVSNIGFSYLLEKTLYLND